jgi:hypothetical protein
MATSALINIYDENDNHLLGIHIQYDGGKILKTNLDRIIKEGRYINALSLSTPVLGEAFLGMGCFAASLISILKKECGNVFITKNTNALNMYDYTYDIRFDNEKNKIVMY